MLIGQQRIKYCEMKTPAEKTVKKFVLRSYICSTVYFDFVKVIFWLMPKFYFVFQPKLR